MSYSSIHTASALQSFLAVNTPVFEAKRLRLSGQNHTTHHDLQEVLVPESFLFSHKENKGPDCSDAGQPP